MRTVVEFNKNWLFSKEKPAASELPRGVRIDLPHTWNGADGQDGGNDYYRGTCYYVKEFDKCSLPVSAHYYLELGAANSSCEVFLNGKSLGSHHGGYSAFRFPLDGLAEHNVITVAVDNSPSNEVYPQMADFTFYGGIYRGARIICLPTSHFDVMHYGGSGLRVRARVAGHDAEVELEAYLFGAKPSQSLTFTVLNAEGTPVSQKSVGVDKTRVKLTIENARLWNGRRDPYLYTARVALFEGGEELDRVELRFGCRSFFVDPSRGFFLNERPYPLRGVSRHQDRPQIGNALEYRHHEEDVDLICELGANAVRLAHYQHAQEFLNLCDERGLVIWAEIPYISRRLERGFDNAASQMRELIIQCYHHPSICFWGLSNEITIGGTDAELVKEHVALNKLCHSLDEDRLTTLAAVSSCGINEEYLQIPDLIAYNHYFGWYGGEPEMNGEWLDDFHRAFPNRPIGLSEYGCEALDWHSSEPRQGDYTEEYQAHYHEELIKQIDERPYIWGTFVWNMFDFGADARAEGGEDGINHKGLVTFDRRYKKDAFYAYKAWLSDEPFVHIAGKRYSERSESVTRVTVYSNAELVELFVDGKSLGKRSGALGVFHFEVPLDGEIRLRAVAGEQHDEATLTRVEKFPEKYRFKESHAVLNWFDVEAPTGVFSLNDKISDILASKEGSALFGELMAQADAAQGAFSVSDEGVVKMLGGFSLLRFLGLAGTFGLKFTKDELLELNAKLNKIEK